MDGSLRSSHGNAFFTGFGNNKRIVFYDTLLETITPKEMESILGHELGHYKLGHIRRTLISSIFFGFLGFYILLKKEITSLQLVTKEYLHPNHPL